MSHQFAIIENGVVVNIGMADGPAWPLAGQTAIEIAPGAAQIGDAYADGRFTPAPAPPAPPPTEQDYIDAVQAKLDATARARHYDGILSACSYAAVPNPFQAESMAFIEWRAACWSALYQMQADVASDARSLPSVAEFLGELPAFSG